MNLGLVELRNVRRYVPEYVYLLHYSVFHWRQASFFFSELLLLISEISVLNCTEWYSAILIRTNVWRNGAAPSLSVPMSGVMGLRQHYLYQCLA